MKLKLYSSIVIFFCIQITICQERKFGDVTVAELSTTSDEAFHDASAVILYREINFEYGKALEFHERIKIYNSEGFENSNWTIPFDDIRQLKANTYNLENGKVVKTKVSKDEIFKEELNDDEEISKLAFPQVKEGSIIELKYRVIFIGFSELYTQMSLPIRYEHISVSNGYYGQLSVRQNQFVSLPIKRVEAALTDVFIGENVPGLKEEKFVGNVNNHRGSILMELHRTNYSQTWLGVAEKLYRAEWFGAQMRNGDALYKKDIRALLAGETDTLMMVKKIDRYVKDRIEWDKKLSRGTTYVKSVYRDEKGDSGDINLLLVHMLKSIGVQANPIVVSTKNSGWVKYPQINQFNAVLCAVDVGGERYILDGSQKEAAFAQLPLYYINGMGLIVNTDAKASELLDVSFELHDIEIREPTKNTLLVNTTLDTDKFSMKGHVNKQITNYYALIHRQYYTDLKDETYQETLNEIDLLTVENLTKKHFDSPDKPVAISYDFELQDCIEEIGGKLYFEPLLHLGSKENLFNEEDRLYPIDLEHPYSENYIITFNIPEGYKIESLPDPRLIKLEENIGFLKFNIKESSTQVQVLFNLEIKHQLIPADYYPALSALYGEFVNISKSKIVLSKI